MTETVTVRMSRGDLHTPWGFDIASGERGEPVITNVRGGSLADRAGLRNGDVLEVLEGLDNLDALAADRLVVTSRNQIELIVHRSPGGTNTRSWKQPDFASADVTSTINKFQSASLNDRRSPAAPFTNGNSTAPHHNNNNTERSIKVNLEHRPQVVTPKGFNNSTLPFNADPRVQHLQYNSPINLYSPQNAAEQYLQQTGGLFGTDPKLAKSQQPSFLQSETLRLVQEEDSRGNREVRLRPEPAPTLSSHPNPQNLPVCFLCGRHILGVMCRAAGKDLHADCFVCATCGAPLRNQGHHALNDKFYCDVHGRQRQQFGAAPPLPPDIVVRTPPTAAHPVRNQEAVKAAYQPEIMARGPVSISPTPWKTQSPISPSNRGVPPSNAQYGQELKQQVFRESSSYATSTPPPPPSNPPPAAHPPVVVKVAATVSAPAPVLAKLTIPLPDISIQQPTPTDPTPPELPKEKNYSEIQREEHEKASESTETMEQLRETEKPKEQSTALLIESKEPKHQAAQQEGRSVERGPQKAAFSSTAPLSARLPAPVKAVTSPRLRGSIRSRQWPPPGMQPNRYWKIDANADKKEDSGTTLQDFVRAEDRERSVSPNRRVLRGQARPVPPSDNQRLTQPVRPAAQISPPGSRGPHRPQQIKTEERTSQRSVEIPVKIETTPLTIQRPQEIPVKVEIQQPVRDERIIGITVSPGYKPPVREEPEPRRPTPTVAHSEAFVKKEEKAEASVSIEGPKQSPSLPKGIVATRRPSLFKAEDFASERRASTEELKPLQIPVTTPPVYAMNSPKPFIREPQQVSDSSRAPEPTKLFELPAFLASPTKLSPTEVYNSLPRPFKGANKGTGAKRKVDFSKDPELPPELPKSPENVKGAEHEHNTNTLLRLSKRAQELTPKLDNVPLSEEGERKKRDEKLMKEKTLKNVTRTPPPTPSEGVPPPVPLHRKPPQKKKEISQATITLSETRELLREHKRVILGVAPIIELPQAHPEYPKELEERVKQVVNQMPSPVAASLTPIPFLPTPLPHSQKLLPPRGNHGPKKDWMESAEVVDESDILTEVSKLSEAGEEGEADVEDDESSLHLPSFDEATSRFLRTSDRLLYDDDEAEEELVFEEDTNRQDNNSDSSTEREYSEEEATETTKERWMREEVEQAKQEEQGLAVAPVTPRRQSNNAVEDEEELEQLNRDLEIVAELNRRLDDISELDDDDKQRAIESIERHQRSLEDQQEELSGLLDSAIAFLRNLDHELGTRRLQKQLEEDALGLEGVVDTNQLNDVLEELRSISCFAPIMIVEAREADEDATLRELEFELPSDLPAPEPRVLSRESENTLRSDPLETPQSSPQLGSTADFIVRRLRDAKEEEEAEAIEGGSSYTRTTFREERRTENRNEEEVRSRIVSQLSSSTPGGKVPFCEACKLQIRGAYVLAAGQAWCPEHFVCANASCGRRLLDVGFVEEKGKKYCEACFAAHIAPRCAKCSKDCLNALQRQWHPECFTCAHCARPFGNAAFYLENGQPYCEKDWNQLFTTKCVSCHYPIEAGDRWVEALGSAYHSNCFNCTRCQTNLEGESFYAKNGQPYCKQHA